MFVSFGKDPDWWNKGLAQAKSNILLSIRTFASDHASGHVRCTDEKTDRCSQSPNPEHGKEAAPAQIDRVVTFPGADFHTPFAASTDSRCEPSSRATSDTGKRPARPGKAAVTSNAIFDDCFSVKPESPSQNLEDSNPSQDTETHLIGTFRAARTRLTLPNTPFSNPETQKPIYFRYDDSILAEAIDTGRLGIGQTTIFDAMLQYSFQDAKGKWQPYCRNDDLNRHRIIDAPPAKSCQASRSSFGIPPGDRKGKKPVYHGFAENFEDVSLMTAEQRAEAPPRGPPISSHRNSDTSSTATKCTCTPNDAKLALELYLQSTEKQHKQLKKGLRRAGGMTHVLSNSAEDGVLVRKLSQLHLTVAELAGLVKAEEIVSSVTLTEIHRLMDKALKPVSELVCALSGEMAAFSLDCNGWRRRRQRRATKQRLKGDWEPRMRALAAKVDQAEAWTQLVGIRMTRAGLEW